MKINVRMEGGLGDHLVANRFAPAILDKYPGAEIKIFSDTEGNHRTLDSILNLFPNFYLRGGEVIESRNSKEYKISTQFGEENYPSHISNQKIETLRRMFDCDKFYDLHIDGLNWLDYDFDWLRYYYFFPKPHKVLSQKYTEDKYLMIHLYSRPNSPYNLDQSYTLQLINKLSEFSKIVIIIEDKYKNYYDSISDNPNIIIDTSDTIEDIFSIASNCSAFIGIDSGIRYIPYHFSKPTFVFSNYCRQYGDIAYSHLVRWLIFQKNVFPMHMDIAIVQQIIQNSLSNKAYHLFPEILSNINQFIIKRKL